MRWLGKRAACQGVSRMRPSTTPNVPAPPQCRSHLYTPTSCCHEWILTPPSSSRVRLLCVVDRVLLPRSTKRTRGITLGGSVAVTGVACMNREAGSPTWHDGRPGSWHTGTWPGHHAGTRGVTEPPCQHPRRKRQRTTGSGPGSEIASRGTLQKPGPPPASSLPVATAATSTTATCPAVHAVPAGTP